MSGNLKQIHFI